MKKRIFLTISAFIALVTVEFLCLGAIPTPPAMPNDAMITAATRQQTTLNRQAALVAAQESQKEPMEEQQKGPRGERRVIFNPNVAGEIAGRLPQRIDVGPAETRGTARAKQEPVVNWTPGQGATGKPHNYTPVKPVRMGFEGVNTSVLRERINTLQRTSGSENQQPETERRHSAGRRSPIQKPVIAQKPATHTHHHHHAAMVKPVEVVEEYNEWEMIDQPAAAAAQVIDEPDFGIEDEANVATFRTIIKLAQNDPNLSQADITDLVNAAVTNFGSTLDEDVVRVLIASYLDRMDLF